MILKDDTVKLHSFDSPSDTEYLFRLIEACPWTKAPKEQWQEAINHGKEFWKVELLGGNLGGVIYLSYISELDWWTFDAYRDERYLARREDRRTGDWSFRSGELVIKYFFETKSCDRLYTSHLRKNRFATLVCERLGFKKCGSLQNKFGDFQVLVKTRN